jgi:hypothetical protein
MTDIAKEPKDWWDERTDFEQIALIIGCIVGAIILFSLIGMLSGVLAVFKIILFILFMPFRIIAAIFRIK